VARPPLHLAQQRSLSPDRQSFQPLAPVAVAGFLEGYGYEARADLDVWAQRPGSATAPVMAFEVAGHEERGGHTWYQMKCSLMAPRSVPALRWKVERRLSSLREELHDRIKDGLGSSYATYFGKTPFALKGGLPGTTARLNLWFGSLAEVVNRGDAQPSVVALLLLFLEAPEPGEPTGPEPQEAEARVGDGVAPSFQEEPPSGLSPQKSAGARTAGPEVTEEITEIEISLEDTAFPGSRTLVRALQVAHATVGMAQPERPERPGSPHAGRLSRLPELLPPGFSEAQRVLYDRILSGAKDASGKPLKTRVNEETGGLLGPFNSFLRSPELGGQLATLAETLRFGDLQANQRLLEKWYAQLNFQTADGVVQAIDPTSYAANDVLARLQAKEEEVANKEDPEIARQEWHKKLREHAEARTLRTVHVSGLPASTTLQELQRLGEQFGSVEQLRLDRDAKGAKELGIARGCCLKRTFLVTLRKVDESVVIFSESKSEVNSTDIEEATVEFRHPCVDRALASAGTEPTTQPQGKFWDELAEKQRQLYNRKLEKVRATAEAILGPGTTPSPPPSPPEEDDFFAWAKQAAAIFNPEAEEQSADIAEGNLEERPAASEELGPVDLEEHPDIVPGTELAVLQDSSSEEISESSAASGIEQVGGKFADGPRAQRKRRAALRRERTRRQPKAKSLAAAAKLPITPAQWAASAAAARAESAEKLKSPAQWAAARARALERLKAKTPGSQRWKRRGFTGEVQVLAETLEAEEPDIASALDLTQPKRARNKQLCILRTVRSTGASYALWSHAKLASAAGLPSEVIDALQSGEEAQKVSGRLRRDEQVALRLCDELLQAGMTVSEETYRAAVQQLGERCTFEVAATIGFYLLLIILQQTPVKHRMPALQLIMGLVVQHHVSFSDSPGLQLTSPGAGHAMLRLLVTLAAVKAATVCQDDLTTPSTDTHAAGSILLQSSQIRDRDREVWDSNTKLNSSQREKSFAFLPWQVLYLLQGDRQLLRLLRETTPDAPQAPEAGFASLLICLSCVLLTVCVCAWSLGRAGDDPIKGTGRAPLPSMRPSLEPSRGQCRPPEGPAPHVLLVSTHSGS
ncbi:unnamed protein product, partial [Symbiodinium necroappetens]